MGCTREVLASTSDAYKCRRMSAFGQKRTSTIGDARSVPCIPRHGPEDSLFVKAKWGICMSAIGY